MFWNNDFIPATTHIDTLLTQPDIKLSEILFEEDVLQELKTYNGNLLTYLCKPEIIVELVDNIAQLTRENCSEKLLYSRVHEAYLSCEILTAGQTEIFSALSSSENLKKIIGCLTQQPDKEDDQRIIPQKATLVSKLISNIHSGAPDILSCYITQDMESFSRLISLLVDNIDVSGSFEILSTFISRTEPSESRYVFCELLSKLDFAFKLIDVMTLSDVEDKQRNACQLLCDIIVIGRQVASEQTTTTATANNTNTNTPATNNNSVNNHTDSNNTDTNTGPSVQDMLSELLESSKAVHLILAHMFPDSTSATSDTNAAKNSESNQDKNKDKEEEGEEVEKKEEEKVEEEKEKGEEAKEGRSINTTAIVCGMKVLQTLVEQKKINDVHYQNLVKTIDRIQDEIVDYLIKFHELLLNPPKQEPIKTTFGVIQKPLGYIRFEVVNSIRALISTNSPKIVRKLVELKTIQVIIDLFIEYSWNNLLHTQVEQALCLIIKNCRSDEEMNYPNEKPADEIPSKALLSQALNECDLIGRLLLQTRNGDQANFGHIIQIINSIAINSDLDVIQDHLSEMKEKRSELHDKWTTFVNVDVASFKEIELYYDNHVENRFEQLRHNHITNNNHFINSPSSNHHHNNDSRSFDSNSTNDVELEAKMMELKGVGDDELKTYIAYTKETVIPTINVDVLPKLRSSNKQLTMNMSTKID